VRGILHRSQEDELNFANINIMICKSHTEFADGLQMKIIVEKSEQYVLFFYKIHLLERSIFAICEKVRFVFN